MWQDLKYVLRVHARQPLLFVAIVGTLALGIGGSTAIFSVVNAVLLRDLPYTDPGQLYVMRSVMPDGTTPSVTRREFSPIYEAPEHALVASAAVGWSQDSQIIGEDGIPRLTRRYGVTDRFFDVFQVRIELGPGFQAGDPPGPIVITHDIWRDLFGSDPDIIGKSVNVEGINRQVVGVAEAGFEFPLDPGFFYLMSVGVPYDNVRYMAWMRLKPDVTREQMQAYTAILAQENGPDPTTGRPPIYQVRPFLEQVVGDLRPTVLILFGATMLLLLIAAINVTNLLLSRATARAREVALREALGASRWRVIRSLLTESVALTTIGGLLGAGIAALGVRLNLGIAPDGLPRLDAVPVDTRVILFAVGVTLLIGVVVALAPAVRLIRNPLSSLVSEAGRGSAAGGSRNRLFSGLVVTEVALAVLLVIGAGLLVRSFANLNATDPGFQAGDALTFYMNVPGRSEAFIVENAQGQQELDGSYSPMADFYRELEERIGALPGVEMVATTQLLPLGTPLVAGIAFERMDRPPTSGTEAEQTVVTNAVSPDLFEALDIEVRAGRVFASADRADSEGVVVVSKSFADRYFPGENPVGKRLRFPDNRYVPGQPGFQFSHRIGDEFTIVGVVGDVRYTSLGEPAEPVVYFTSEQWTQRRRTAVVQAAVNDPVGLVGAIRYEIEAMDPQVTADFAMYPGIIRDSIARERLATSLLTVFGLLALALATVGVYGLISYSVSERRGEIAVRMAIGASPGGVVQHFTRRGTMLAAGGVALGAVGAVSARQAIASQLYGVSPVDPVVFIVVPALLLVVAGLASYVPARRAANVDPANLLRAE